MANAAELRRAITRSARDAAAENPEDPDARMASFAAKLYGHMAVLGEFEAEDALWLDLLMMRRQASQAGMPATLHAEAFHGDR